MGHPIQLGLFFFCGFILLLEHESYARHRFGFNMCFVVGQKSTNDCMYEPLVQKLAEYLVELEQVIISLKILFRLARKISK